MNTPAPSRVDFFFDPICPWAYQSSLWIRDVRDLCGVEVGWRFFSLEEINHVEGKKHSWERPWTYGWSLMRVGAHLRRKDPALLDRWYAAVGKALHEDGRKVFLPEGAAEVAAEIGLPEDTIGEALADDTTHDDVKADHEFVVGTYGAFGVPTLVFPDAPSGGQSSQAPCIFGPNIVPGPRGANAVRLWELVGLWLEFPHLYEMRTPKTPRDHGHIGTTFAPYLQARQWQTIQRPVA